LSTREKASRVFFERNEESMTFSITSQGRAEENGAESDMLVAWDQYRVRYGVD
jgi:hypothetical protein